MSKLMEGLASIVPTGKQMAWIVGFAATSFMAGVGATLQMTDYADLPQEVDSLFVLTENNAESVQRVERGLIATQQELSRIRCLSRLSATGQTIDPLEIDDVCP